MAGNGSVTASVRAARITASLNARGLGGTFSAETLDDGRVVVRNNGTTSDSYLLDYYMRRVPGMARDEFMTGGVIVT